MIPKDSEFCQLLFQAFTKSAIIPHIIGGDAKKFVGEIVLPQHFQDKARHILTVMVVTEAFECQDFLMKVEIGINPMRSNPYHVSEMIVGETGIEMVSGKKWFFPSHHW